MLSLMNEMMQKWKPEQLNEVSGEEAGAFVQACDEAQNEPWLLGALDLELWGHDTHYLLAVLARLENAAEAEISSSMQFNDVRETADKARAESSLMERSVSRGSPYDVESARVCLSSKCHELVEDIVESLEHALVLPIWGFFRPPRGIGRPLLRGVDPEKPLKDVLKILNSKNFYIVLVEPTSIEVPEVMGP